MKCAFTIVAKNYIGLAKILRNSYLQFNKSPFYIIVVDDFINLSSDDFIYEAKTILNIPKSEWLEMAMKYDLTEFCTSIKPFCFKYFFENYDKVVYLDPDILLYNGFDDIYNYLNKYSMILTPHISECHVIYKGDLKENQLLGSGVFNLGFCAVRKNCFSEQILDWWGERLKTMCFSDPLEYLYTDQHWMDMMPCFLGDKLLVLRDIGYNVAPWNFFERKIVCHDGKFNVVLRDIENSEKVPLVFVHYSGYDYKSVLLGGFAQKNISQLQRYEDVSFILNAYQEMLLANKEVFEKYVDMEYTYNYFSDKKKTPVRVFHRRLYNALIIRGTFLSENPFCINSSFWNRLILANLIPRSRTNVDRETSRSLRNFRQKEERLNTLFLFLFKLLGYSRYVMLIKIMRFYSRMEKHSFLMQK